MKYLMLIFILNSLFCLQELRAQEYQEEKAPSLSGVKFFDGKLPDIEGKFVFIDFWATWCKPCIKSLPHLNQLAEKFEDRIVFLAISDEKEDKVSRFLNRRSLSQLTFGLDIQKHLYASLNIRSIPHFFLISPGNTIAASGNSSQVTEVFLDSILLNYNTIDSPRKDKIVVTPDIVEKTSSIEIIEKPNAKPYFSESGYTLIARDSIKNLIPYLSGLAANRLKFVDLSPKVIEVRIFSRLAPYDLLKKIGYLQLLTSYGISETKVDKEMIVYNFSIDDSSALSNRDTYIEEGVAKKRYRVNSTTIRFDNYTLSEIVGFLELAYHPKIFYSDLKNVKEYDWDIELLDSSTNGLIEFSLLTELLMHKYGIRITEEKQTENFIIYK